MQRPCPAGLFASGFVELELQDTGEKIAGVGRVTGDMEFGTGVEISFAAFDGRDDALILQPQIGPCLVIGSRRRRA